MYNVRHQDCSATFRDTMNVHNATNVKYRRDIDGLRAVAILPIVIFHIFPSLIPGGFIGVDVFFVISGYLISSIIIDGLAAEKFSFANFYARRIKRIFPAMIVVMACCLAFGWFALLPDEFEHLGKYVLGGSAFADNIVLWREAGYFDRATDLKPLVHLWTLGVEEQFYLLYPFLFWLAWRARFNLLATAVALLAFSFLLNVVLVGRAPAATFNLLPTRLWELTAGSVLACMHLRYPERRVLPAGSENVAAAFGLALLVAALFAIDRETTFPGWWALVPVLSTYLLIAAGPRSWVNAKILANPHVVFVGLISYPLYLWHWPLISFAQIIETQIPSLRIRAIILAVSLALAYATFALLEKPIRFGRLARVRPLVPALCGLSVAVAAAGAFAFDGTIPIFTKAVLDNNVAQFAKRDPALIVSEECRKFVGNRTLGYCVRSAPLPPQMAVIGDSHSNSFYTGLAKAYRKLGITVINVGAPGCIPLYNALEVYRDPQGKLYPCTEDMNFALNFVATSPSIQTIIFSVRGPTSRDFNRTSFARGYRETLERMTKIGKEIILLLDWPDLGFDPKSCLDVRPVRLTNRVRTPCATPRFAIDAKSKDYRELIYSLQREFPGVRVFDTLQYMCDSSWCYAMKDGRMLYTDDNHIGVIGSEYLGERFLAEFRPPLN